MLSLQEIFDKGLAHIRKQGVPSKRGFGCLYNGPNGTSCIVGGLMEPEHRRREFDVATSSSVRAMIRSDEAFVNALSMVGLDVEDPRVIDLLEELQWCHDKASEGEEDDFMGEFETHMADLAAARGLDYTCPGGSAR